MNGNVLIVVSNRFEERACLGSRDECISIHIFEDMSLS